MKGSLQYDVLAPMSSTDRMPNKKKMQSMMTTVLVTGTTDFDTETKTWRILFDLLTMLSGLKARNVFAKEMKFVLEERLLPPWFAIKMLSTIRSKREIKAKIKSKLFHVTLRKSLGPIAYKLGKGWAQRIEIRADTGNETGGHSASTYFYRSALRLEQRQETRCTILFRSLCCKKTKAMKV